MDNAHTLIARLGGTTEAARKLGVPITTVDGWRARNRIPHWRMDSVRKAIADQQKAQA